MPTLWAFPHRIADWFANLRRACSAAPFAGARVLIPTGREQTAEEALLDRVHGYTMTSRERLLCLKDAVDYVTRCGIPGGIVECGVWRGGSMMLAALRLIELGSPCRDLWLFDTFEGMTPPTLDDHDLAGRAASDLLKAGEIANDGQSYWCYSPIDEVRANLETTGYSPSLCHLVKGPVEETIPDSAPDEIAILRLDTDWYASTKHELIHLYPRLVSGGVLIVDDYGHWQGARRAVDEYVSGECLNIFLQRIDYTGRCGVKPRGR